MVTRDGSETNWEGLSNANGQEFLVNWMRSDEQTQHSGEFDLRRAPGAEAGEAVKK